MVCGYYSIVDIWPYISGFTNQIADLFFPPHCVHCGCAGAWLCAKCKGGLVFFSDVQRTRFAPSHLDQVYSLCWHSGPARSSALALKYEGLRILAEPLGEMMYDYWRQIGIDVDLVVPVALHKRRRRSRGYNQAALLAHQIAGRAGLMMDKDCLVRQKQTMSQVGLGRQERWQNVQDAFICNKQLDGISVLLVDDVLTTGATLEAAAAALREAGASKVYGLTLSRATRTDQKI